MKYLKIFSPNSISNKNPTPLKLHSSHFSSRPKPSNKTPNPRQSSAYKKPRPKQSAPSLLQRITELVGSEDPAFSLSRDSDFDNATAQVRTPTVCRNARESSSIPNSSESAETHVDSSSLVDVSPTVHRITEALRSENAGFSTEQRLEEMGIEFSPEIVEKVLKRCFKVRRLALWFFDWVKLRPGFCHTTETYNGMIYMAGEAGDFDLVEKLVSEMNEASCLKNVKTWTILISHYGKARKISKALSAFEEMKQLGCELDGWVYDAVLRALVAAGKAELAMEYYKEMVSRNVEVVDVNLYELLMICFSRLGDIAAARTVGDDMIKSTKVSESEGYTCLLKSFCISGKIDEAQALMEEINRKNLETGSEALEVLLKGLCRANRMDEAMRVANDMKQHSAVDGKIYSFLIDGLLRNGNTSKALELFHGMKELNCVPTVSTYTQIIQHLFRLNEFKKACEVYEEMIENGIKPDVVVVTAMVAGHVQHNRTFEAWELFESMKQKGMKPTWKAYSVFIKELCKASKPEDVLKLLSELVASNLNAADDIFGFAASSLRRMGEIEKARIVKEMSRSLKLNEKMQPIRPCQHLGDQPPIRQVREVSNCTSNQEDLKPRQTSKEYSETDLKELCRVVSSSTDWRSTVEVLESSTIDFTPELVAAVLDRCKRHGCAALRFFAWLRKKAGYKHTADTYNLAIKISGSAKDFRHMREIYRDMRGSGCSVTPNTWTIMISQYGQAGLTEIALNTFKEMKHQGYPPNASTFKYLIVFLCGKKGRKMEEAIKIFNEMLNEGFMPDRETVDIYLSSLCESGKLVNARRCVKYLLKKGFARQLAYSLLVKSLCRAGEVEEALVLAKETEHDGCTLDHFIYASLVHALLRAGRLDEASDKVEEMERAGISRSVQIQTSFIVHFCREEKIEKAVEIFTKMREDGHEPTLVTYSAMIRGYMKVGMISDAWDIFHQMKVRGPSPDFETYSMFISCLCKAGRSEVGLQLIHEMLASGIIPSAVNFRAVFYGLNREGKQDLAHSVLQTKWNLKRQRMFSH